MSSSDATKEYLPQEIESLLVQDQRATLAESRKRMRQASSASLASTSSDFLAVKIDALVSEVNHIEDCKTAIHGLSHLRRLPPLVASERLKSLALASTPLNDEIRVIKRQRRLIQEDMEEAMPRYKDLESAYIDAMVSKVATASGNQSKYKFKANKFRVAVEEFYEASKMEGADEFKKLAHCHVLGWFLSKDVRAAHLVPKSLDECSVAHLFGAGTITIDDPRNSLMLHQHIEMAMDKGSIVIVPLKAPEAREMVKWKVLVTDPTLLNHIILPKVKWKDIHGKTLTFLGHNRPAKRYLYFRYVMTYLMLKNKGRLDWAQEVETGKCMWATPGKYLRRSMLVNLARRVSDHYLPEVFYNTTTFDVSDNGTDAQETEDSLAIILANNMLTHHKEKEDEDEDDEDDDKEPKE
ncbi:hypothetical protein McanMca71_006359 [Microsporum canis]|uniref:HNH nuclease domain-containing protein n=1 Tax=Arthroderma otae (strain ATCC MYA-4605 / CBS 113480) TaxID=554155 RepID=C5FC35_ARTOC|nr:conserved hypothetical protein [Microsporum canis CBS 113480]EEQ27458.1 conserved hypothetical protein [Microsporum canis CBS 113480]